MGFLLPVLLLGLAQPPMHPVDVFAPPEQTQGNRSSDGISDRKFIFSRAETKIGSPLDRIEIHDAPDAGATGCLTMRSYYFKRRDGNAPEFVRMTTCEPIHRFTTKRVERPAR